MALATFDVDKFRGAHDDAASRASGAPVVPTSLADAGLPEPFVVELLLKHLRSASELTLGVLGARLGLPARILESVLARMRDLALVEVPRRGSFDAQVSYALTDRGKALASEAFEKCQYCGKAPVTLAQFAARIRAQSARGSGVTESEIRRCLAGLVAPKQLVEQLGASLSSGRPIYLYGPSGSGKTFLAEHMVRALKGTIWVPHALLIDDQVIQIFDPLVHRPVAAPGADASLDRSVLWDVRWVEAERPVVIAGGELTIDMLDLEFDPLTRFYSAPPQVRASNGMLIIDDLGRQRTSARELMNRWIVPLDRNVDYLALHTGTKFSIPFDVQVIFSSNLAPMELADPAFVRRLGYKVFVGEMDETSYREVVDMAAKRAGIALNRASVDFLIHSLHARSRIPLLPAFPYDLLSKVRDRALFQGREPRVNEDELEWAWRLYFAADDMVPPDPQ